MDTITRVNWNGEPRLLPEASLIRRLIALAIDWTMCRLIAGLLSPALFFENTFSTLFIFFIEVTLFTIAFQASAGQRIMGIRILTYPDQLRVAPQKIVLRTLLICLVIPAVLTSKGRALHDHFTNSQSVRELY